MALLMAALLLTAQAQRMAYASPADLKGLTRVFVDTNGDTKERARIQDEIRKAGLALSFLDSEDHAEIILVFRTGREERLGGLVTNKNGKGNETSTATYQQITKGQGQVLVVANGETRVVLSFEDDKKSVLERNPATNFARAFIRAYGGANGRGVGR
jgi:hypothetical protein